MHQLVLFWMASAHDVVEGQIPTETTSTAACVAEQAIAPRGKNYGMKNR